MGRVPARHGCADPGVDPAEYGRAAKPPHYAGDVVRRRGFSASGLASDCPRKLSGSAPRAAMTAASILGATASMPFAPITSKVTIRLSAALGPSSAPTRSAFSTVPTGRLPNARRLQSFGAYDMVGNVFEWTNDWYHPSYYTFGPDVNPRGRTARGLRPCAVARTRLTPATCGPRTERETPRTSKVRTWDFAAPLAPRWARVRCCAARRGAR